MNDAIRCGSPTALVVGAGPVGLTLATVLARQGMSVRIVDRNDAPTGKSKAIGIHARTLELMHTLGVAEAMVARGNPMRRFRVNADERCIIDTSFAGIESRYSFVLGLPQSQTEALLLEKLHAAGVTVERQSEVVDIVDPGDPGDASRPARVTVRRVDGSHETITPAWLCGCDGSRSAVRTLLGIDFPGGDYRRAFILGDVKLDWDGPRDELQFFISRRGYLLVIPMPGGMHRVIAQTDRTLAEFEGDEKPRATLEELRAVVERNGPGGIRLHSPDWVTHAPFYYRLASEARRGRAFLLGDALHLYSPLGAQGLNTGVHDAFNLGWKLSHAVQGTATLSLLDTYSEERMRIAHAIARVTSRTTAFVTNTSPAYRAGRKWLVPFLRNTRYLKEDLPRLMAGLRQSYAGTALSRGSAVGNLKSGDRCPHANVRVAGRLMPLADLVHGRTFTLLVLNRCDSPEVRWATQRWIAQREPMPVIDLVYVTRERDPDGPVVKDTDWRCIDDGPGEVFHAFGMHHGLVLLRPDGHVAWLDDDIHNLASVEQYFTSKFWSAGGRLPQAAAS